MLGRTNAGGGAGLNFKVVGGTARPANPTYNTLWVNTEASIPGWAFDTSEPKNPVEGLVWFKTGVESLIVLNALRKNTITLRLVGCWQYLAGAWVLKVAECWQDEWISLTQVVFDATTAEDASMFLNSSGSAPSTYCSLVNREYVEINANAGSTANVTLSGLYDLTPFSKLTAKLRASNTLCSIQLRSNAGGSWASVARADLDGGGNPKEYSIDTSGLLGEHQIYFVTASGRTQRVYDIKLEV